MHSVPTQVIVIGLLKVFSWVENPRVVIAEQGTAFKSQLMQEMWSLLRVHLIKTSVFRLQMDGLVDRFNHTLKEMLQKFITVESQNWDKMLLYLLFVINKVHSLQLCGRQPPGILDLPQEPWQDRVPQPFT